MQFTYLFFLDHIMVEELVGPLFCCVQAPHMLIAPRVSWLILTIALAFLMSSYVFEM